MSLDAETADTLIQHALRLARQAGSRIVEVYGTEVDVTIKADQTPVTTADIAAHDIIVEGLSALSPQYPVLSEESEDIPFKERNDWNRYWLCLLYTSPSPRDRTRSRMPSSA